MKKYIVLAFGAAVAFASCAKTEIAEVDAPGATTTFTCAIDATKLSLGDKDGSSYQLVWDAKDSLFVKKASDRSALGVAKLTSGAGTNKAEFAFNGTIADGTDVVLVYGKNNTVPAEQKYSSPKDISNYGYAESEPVTVAGGSASFTLTVFPKAIVKVAVSSSEFAGASLTGITFRSMGASLSETTDFVNVTLSTPLTLSTTLQDVCFSAQPVDLTGNKVFVAFNITTAGGDTYTIPVEYKGGNLMACSVNALAVEDLKGSDCVSWYVAKENRLRGGLGYAYGDANTYLIQCKNGSTYTGGTYTPDASVPSSVTIDARARGDFRYVEDPTGATFEFCKLGAIAEGQYNGTGAIYTFRNSDIKASTAVDPTKYSFVDNGDLTVTVTNEAAFAGAPILMMVKGGKILWSWTFWNIAADGTQLQTMNFNGAELANLLIGQSSNQASWVAKSGVSFIHTVNYYQWGRITPVFWQSFWSFRYMGKNQTGNIPALAGPVSMKDSFAPGAITKFGSTDDMTHWCTEQYGDLWGNLNKTIGTKSVYDPCPKGWRVADSKVYEDAADALGSGLTITYQNTALKHGIFASTDPSVLMINAGYVQMKLGGTDAAARPTNMGNSATGAGNVNGRYWSNKAGAHTSAQPNAFMFSSSGSATSSTFRKCTMNRAALLPVRCQRDTDNR